MTTHKAEFDEYARDYDGGADGPIKAILGNDKAFIEWKVIWLVNYLRRQKAATKPLRVLDLGCGTGLMLALWSLRNPQDIVCGADVSENMLGEAKRRWVGRSTPEFRVLRQGERTWSAESFDLVMISCVLHHIQPDERDAFIGDAVQLLKPGGHVCIFEHNPRNCLVRYIVRNTKIDRNAILLRAEETAQRLKRAECVDINTSFILFLPPVLKMIAALERPLASVPFGGQYAITARRNAKQDRSNAN